MAATVPSLPPMEPSPTTPQTFYALINYEDLYVQPLILSALQKHFPNTHHLISNLSELPSPASPLLQFIQYESIDFSHLVSHPTTSLANAYVIRKALIRKHYLATTVRNWVVKYPESVLGRGWKGGVEFEVDYAEFLDEALVEAYELRESWERNSMLEEEDGKKKKEWWILKPGMSERGQGIRLFSSEEELTAIFEEWDPVDSDDEEDVQAGDARSDHSNTPRHPKPSKGTGNGIITSQLRHFIAQPYIHPPLLLSPSSSPSSTTAPRKFHIRTYVLATGALKVYVYRPMLALFAAKPYLPPSSDLLNNPEGLKAHLTNTCLQDSGEREGSVGLFWDLPSLPSQAEDWKPLISTQILALTSSLFEAAARGMSIHFQPLPNAFEIFGLDFMVGIEDDGSLNTYLLEVNAFPDFRQTGEELRGVVEGLFEEVVRIGVGGFFGGHGEREVGWKEGINGEAKMVKVLDIDLGKR